MDLEGFRHHDWRERERLRELLRSARRLRKQAEFARAEAAVALQSAVIETYGVFTVVEIARLAGVSRRAVYDAWAAAEPLLEG